MTLSEKILELRTAQNLSQGELAEKLDVSRQSVSKWETNQSVPELDKIVKLADLFGVTVDELVREGETPQLAQPEAPCAPKPERAAVYAQWKFTPIQTLGILLIAGGMMMMMRSGSIASLGCLSPKDSSSSMTRKAAFLWI